MKDEKMTIEEANKIFKYWIEYIEINDKLSQIFVYIPESFLPYPLIEIENALNIIAKKYFDDGNKKMSNNIKKNMASLIRYKKDDEAINNIINDLSLKDEEIKKLKIINLKKVKDSWLSTKN